MPGVPSSRGCEACRKLKKRCDQLKPVCSRCSRLCIPCIGSGQQRYKFQNEEFKVDSKNHKALVRSKRIRIDPTSSSLPPSLINKVDILTCSFISAVEVRDPRYNLNFLIPFHRGLILRLGTNDALDASVEATTIAYADLRRDTLSVDFLSSYGRALRALRLCLDDPAKATTIETLTAIYLIIIFQGFIQKSDSDHNTLSHAEILVYILNAATRQQHNDEFELEIMFAMTYTVLFSSILNPKIILDPWFPKILVLFDFSQSAAKADRDSQSTNTDHDSLPMLQDFVTSPWNDLRKVAEIVTALRHPVAHRAEMIELYELFEINRGSSLNNLGRIIEFISSKTWPPGDSLTAYPQLENIFQYCQTSYSIILTLTLIISAIIQVNSPDEEVLARENEYYCQEIVELGQQMSRYRPLGATFVPVGLSAVCAVSRCAPTAKAARNLLLDYSTDFKGLCWMDTAEWFNQAFKELRSKLGNRARHASNPNLLEDNTADGWGDSAPPNGACFVQ